MLCEGAFPLMETDEKNFMILQGTAKALKPAGSLYLMRSTGFIHSFIMLKESINQSGSDVVSIHNNFDLMTFRDKSTIEVNDDS